MPPITPPAATSSDDPRPRQVLVIGDVMTDVIVKPDGPLARGTDRRATIRSLPGGSGANQALWLAHFGIDVSFVAKVGQRDLDHLAAGLRHHGVKPRLAADADLPTGTLVTILDPDGERSFFTDRGANESLDCDDLPAHLLDGINLLHISGYALFAERPRLAVLALMQQARQRNITVTIDPASTGFLKEVGPAAFLDWTREAAICFPNEAEAALLTGTTDWATQRRRLAEHYPLTVIKRGGAGAEIADRTGVNDISLPATTVNALDTTGAGDAFLARFLASYLRQEPLATCLRHGIAAGTQATLSFGGRPVK